MVEHQQLPALIAEVTACAKQAAGDCAEGALPPTCCASAELQPCRSDTFCPAAAHARQRGKAAAAVWAWPCLVHTPCYALLPLQSRMADAQLAASAAAQPAINANDPPTMHSLRTNSLCVVLTEPSHSVLLRHLAHLPSHAAVECADRPSVVLLSQRQRDCQRRITLSAAVTRLRYGSVCCRVACGSARDGAGVGAAAAAGQIKASRNTSPARTR